MRPERLIELTRLLVDIASPTGLERPLAEALVEEMARLGLDADLVVGADPANGAEVVSAVGRLAGAETGRRLLLYAPIDTVTTGEAVEDLPWAGAELRPDMTPGASVLRSVEGGAAVVGLGAQNPKGHAACVLAAAEAVARAVDAGALDIAGELQLGFGACGMPANRWAPDLADGHGQGAADVVRCLDPDAAVIAKTGWAVSWEEVGLTWFQVEVRGSHTYVGSRHLLPYRNAIADAGHLIAGLERWFETWAEAHRSGLVAPQGVVAAVRGGWPHMPAFTTEVCRFWVDLRLSPRTTPEEAAAAFGSEVERLAAEIGADADWSQTVGIPGTTTAPDESVVATSIAAWEAIEGRPHEPIIGLSGATDANILRGLGVPTARIGLPKIASSWFDEPVDFQLGMNAVDVADQRRLTEHLVRVAGAFLGPGEEGAR